MENREIRFNNFAYWANKIGRAELAERAGWEGPGYVNRIMGGYDNVGARTARKVERVLGLDKGWMDLPHPSLWAEAGIAGEMSGSASVVAVGKGDVLPEGLIPIPAKKIKLRGTMPDDGIDVHYEDDEDVEPLYYKKEWLEKRGYRIEALHTRGIKGSSMEPSLWEGDRVLINRDMRTPRQGRAFEVIVEGNPCVKRLEKRGDIWWITSDNEHHKRFDCPLENLEQIRGMVVEKSSEHI